MKATMWACLGMVAMVGVWPVQATAEETNHVIAITTADGGADAGINGGDGGVKALGLNAGMDIKNTVHYAGLGKGYIRFALHQAENNKADIAPAKVDKVSLILEISTGREFAAAMGDWTYNVFLLKPLDAYGEGQLGQDWEEGKITWGNAPGNDAGGGNALLADHIEMLGTFDTEAGKIDKFTFTSAKLTEAVKQAAAAKNGLITLIVTRQDDDNNAATWATKESGKKYTAPTLVITTK